MSPRKYTPPDITNISSFSPRTRAVEKTKNRITRHQLQMLTANKIENNRVINPVLPGTPLLSNVRAAASRSLKNLGNRLFARKEPQLEPLGISPSSSLSPSSGGYKTRKYKSPKKPKKPTILAKKPKKVNKVKKLIKNKAKV
jgi:hypothetical protein